LGGLLRATSDIDGNLDNPDKLSEYKAGKDRLFGFFVGQTMKLSGGEMNPQLVNKVLKDKLS